jgi:hypothetical protein
MVQILCFLLLQPLLRVAVVVVRVATAAVQVAVEVQVLAVREHLVKVVLGAMPHLRLRVVAVALRQLVVTAQHHLLAALVGLDCKTLLAAHHNIIPVAVAAVH